MNDTQNLNLGRVWRGWGIRGLVVLLAMILLAGTVLIPPEITLAQGEETECPECGGDGKVTCPDVIIVLRSALQKALVDPTAKNDLRGRMTAAPGFNDVKRLVVV